MPELNITQKDFEKLYEEDKISQEMFEEFTDGKGDEEDE